MAKRRRPDPAITEKWSALLIAITAKIARRKKLLDEADEELGEAIRGAFAEGVLVGPIKSATGLSGSRIYQRKFELRDEHRTAS